MERYHKNIYFQNMDDLGGLVNELNGQGWKVSSHSLERIKNGQTWKV